MYYKLALILWPLVATFAAAEPAVLDAESFRHHAERFAANDEELVKNHIPNAQAWDWMKANVPLFECPSGTMEEIYYFRWWSFRKHIKQTPDGLVLTEFLQPVSHAGKYNTVACAVGHHLAEARWLRDKELIEDYARYWFQSGEGGAPALHFHKFSSWVPAALYGCYLVSGNDTLCRALLDDMVDDYETWEDERQLTSGLFWQHDVKDGMEESISGGRRVQNVRPTINSYMVANARAIAAIADLDGKSELATTYRAKASTLQEKLLAELWDDEAQFFKVRLQDGKLSDAREAIGYIPWMFKLAGPEHTPAWQQILDRGGFWAPAGLTTAERRHPGFRSHGVGTCEWDGAIWPFATSQTLNGLMNLLRGPTQDVVSAEDFFSQLLIYAKSHELFGMPYIGEYHDEITGAWLITGPKAERSRYYNHSTFGDLIIRGLVGLVPRFDQMVEVDPLLPANSWDWFCLDDVDYHGHRLTILWDKTGRRYRQGAGLRLLANGQEIGSSRSLSKLVVQLPE